MTKLAFSLFISFISINAFAVQTKNCPDSLSVKASDLEITSPLESVLDSEVDYAADEHVEAITKAYENLSAKNSLSASFDLETPAKNGKCLYRKKGGIEKIELYTTRKNDKVYFQKEIGPRGILVRVYAKIESLSKEKVELTADKGGIALAIPRYPYQSYDAGGSLEFVGKAGKVEASVK